MSSGTGDPTRAAAPIDEDQRLATLASYGILDTEAERDYDGITVAAARICGTRYAVITVAGRERQWFKAAVGTSVPGMALDPSITARTMHEPGVTVITDTRLDPRCAGYVAAAGHAPLRFYAGAPLMSPNGHVLGALCVADIEPRTLNSGQCLALESMARQVMVLLELRRQNSALLARMLDLDTERSIKAQILDAAPIGILLFDETGDCVAANEAAARHLGGRREELLAQNLHTIETLRRAGIYDQALRVLASGVTESGAYEYSSSYGRTLWMMVRMSVLHSPAGRWLMLMNDDIGELKRAEREQAELRRRYELLYRTSTDGILLGGADGCIQNANPAACAILQLSENELRGRTSGELTDARDPRLARLLEEHRREGRAHGEVTMVRGDGERFEAEVHTAILNRGLSDESVSVLLRDVTEQRSLALRLERSLNLFDTLTHHVPGVLYQYRRYPDGRACFPYCSAAVATIFEVAAEEVRDSAEPILARVHPDDVEAMRISVRLSAETLEPWALEFRVLLPRAGERWLGGRARPERLDDGSVLWHGYIDDITERKLSEAQIRKLAHYDALTGLPNRSLLLERMAEAVAEADRHQHYSALLYLDIDDFKRINDARGHSVGDRVLARLGRALSTALRPGDIVARLGGDEFVLLLSNLSRDRDAAARAAMVAAERMLRTIGQPLDLDGKVYSLTGSIGLTLFPQAASGVEDLLREADTAMYRAKEKGRNQIAYFESGMQAEVEQRLAIEQDLARAIQAGQMAVHVQPQFDPAGRQTGGELLLRWSHPQRGAVSPAAFIPIAEETGMIVAIGEWVVRQACLALVRLRAADHDLPLSVNISPRQFRHERFVERIAALLAETGAPGSGLVFEVTEGLFIDDWMAVAARMSELTRLGVRFSIDDFGTGYSSLAYLRRLPLHELKIDKSFVKDLPADADAMAIVESIIGVARPLRLMVVAEGVETAEQAASLAASGCDVLQGYHYARPEPLEAWLARQAPRGPRRVAPRSAALPQAAG